MITNNPLHRQPPSLLRLAERKPHSPSLSAPYSFPFFYSMCAAFWRANNPAERSSTHIIPDSCFAATTTNFIYLIMNSSWERKRIRFDSSSALPFHFFIFVTFSSSFLLYTA